MTAYSVAEAKAKLSALIDSAMDGETVVITRHGHAVAEIKPVANTPLAMTDADLAWLKKRRVKRKNSHIDAGTLVSRMRDEEWK